MGNAPTYLTCTLLQEVLVLTHFFALKRIFIFVSINSLIHLSFYLYTNYRGRINPSETWRHDARYSEGKALHINDFTDRLSQSNLAPAAVRQANLMHTIKKVTMILFELLV